MSPKVAVIYYSATGNVHALATAIVGGAGAAGADVRLRRVAELAPERVVRRDKAWADHADATAHVPVASHEDLIWADAYLFGTPTRYGNMASQLKQFIDTTGGLWLAGRLADKAVGAFVSTDEVHGGQESTLLSMYNVFMHWGSIIVPTGYTDDSISAAGGNPYGVSSRQAPNAHELAAARYYGRRVAEKAALLTRSGPVAA